MPDSLVPIARWLTDFHCAALVVMLSAACVMHFVRQPARRLIVAWGAMAGLLLVALITLNPDTTRLRLGLITLPAASSPAGVPHARLALPVAGGDAMPATHGLEADLQPAPGNTPPSSFSWSCTVMVAYLFATGGTALWLAYGWFTTLRLLTGSRPVSPALRHELNHLHPIPKRIRIRLSGRVDQPLAIGLLRPTIVLPDWIFKVPEKDAAIRAALTHEISHVARGDLWLLAVCRWLLLPLFFHPLYWWMRQRIWLDQELLADDSVAREWDAIGYAELLLAWSRQSSRPHYAHAVAMSLRTSSLRARIVTLLDRETRLEPRSSLRWKGAVGLVATACVLLVSSVSVRRGDFNMPISLPVAGREGGEALIVRLADGVELELVGIRQHPCLGQTRWAADGSLLDASSEPLPPQNFSEVIVRLHNPNSVQIDWLSELADFRQLDGNESLALTEAAGDLYAFSMQSSTATVDVRLQLSLGKWRALNAATTTQFAEQDEYAYCLSSPADASAVVHVSHPLADKALQVVAIDYCDRQVEPSLISHRTGAVTATFAEIDTHDIREFHVQTHEQQYVEFRNVSLHPGQRTDVEVVAFDSRRGDSAVKL